MKLYATPLSHFSRKVRILLDLYGLPYEWVDVGNVAEGTAEKFAGNPLCRVPVLEDGLERIFDSDVIAQYIVAKHDPKDRFRVRTASVSDLNVRSVLNGIMSEEVTVIIARRQGVPTDHYKFFNDAMAAIHDGLSWLEERHQQFNPAQPGYLEFHLLSVWEHIRHYDLLPLNFPLLDSIAKEIAKNPVVNQSSPTLLPRKPNAKHESDPQVAAFVAGDRLGALVQARFVSASQDECKYAYTASPSHYNPNNILHGGALFTVMDSSQGMFVHIALGIQAAATGTATVKYLKPISAGELSIRTWLDRREGRKIFVRSEAVDETGAVAASMDEIWITFEPRA